MKIGVIPVQFGLYDVGLSRYMAGVVSHLIQKDGFDVSVLCRNCYDSTQIAERFGVAVHSAKIERFPSCVSWLAKSRSIADKINHFQFARRSLKFDLLWLQCYRIPCFSLAKRSVLLTNFPFDSNPTGTLWRKRLSSYDIVVANSEFTRKWIQRYWQVDSDVVYPPITEYACGNKRPWIISIGRFCAGGREKRQLELIEVYKGLCDDGLEGWEYHVAGIVEHEEYFERVRVAARGYPIVLHPNISYYELRNLYQEAAIFWHAVGIGIDAEKQPSKLEHFGIVTAEAMTAGCVPVVINAGGQPEIVQHGVDGFLWNNISELKHWTTWLIDHPAKRQEMANYAMVSSRSRFGEQAFGQRLDRVLEKVL